MTGAISFAFGAGLLATVNPCGFVMLPSFLGLQLIWLDVCQVGSTESPAVRGFCVAWEAADLAVARRAVRLICAGWLPQDRVSS